MGLFSFTQEIAIDLGTANTIIICDNKVVVDEPSVTFQAHISHRYIIRCKSTKKTVNLQEK